MLDSAHVDEHRDTAAVRQLKTECPQLFCKSHLQGLLLHCGDERLVYNDQEQSARQHAADLVAWDKHAYARIGLKGTDLASTYLHYARFSQLYVLPVQHLLLRGVVSDLVSGLQEKRLRLLSTADLEII